MAIPKGTRPKASASPKACMQHYAIRIELPGGQCIDTHLWALSIERARATAPALYRNLNRWDWCGAVAFVNGARPAEEAGRWWSEDPVAITAGPASPPNDPRSF